MLDKRKERETSKENKGGKAPEHFRSQQEQAKSEEKVRDLEICPSNKISECKHSSLSTSNPK